MARALQTLSAAPSSADEIIGAVIVVISNLFVVGLSKVAYKLHDPFDSEIEDLSVVRLLITSRPLFFGGNFVFE